MPFVYELVEVVCFHLQWIFCPWFFRLAAWRPVSTIHHRRRERCTSWITFYIHIQLTLPSALAVQLPLLLLRRATMQTSTRKVVVHGISNIGRIFFFRTPASDWRIWLSNRGCIHYVTVVRLRGELSLHLLPRLDECFTDCRYSKFGELFTDMHEYSDTLIFVATHLTMSIWNGFNDLPTVSCSSDHTVHRGC